MSVNEDINSIRMVYDEFVNEASSRIKAFFEGKYDTFDKDVGDEVWVKRDFVQKNLERIKKFYAFVCLIDDIFHLDFVEKVKKLAEKYGFKFNTPLVETYGNKAMLALDLALHFPLWGHETYTNHEFHVLGFTREKPIEGCAHFFEVGVVPLLKITVDSNGDLQSIEPRALNLIEGGLRTVFRE